MKGVMKNSILLKVLTMAGAMLLASGGWGFETNVNSEIKGANLTISKTTGNSPTGGNLIVEGNITGGAVLDEDNFGSDSETKLATQQSIKAYVNARVYPTEISLSVSGKTFLQALKHCRDITTGSDQNWRLPTASEMANLCIGTCPQTGWHWTSTVRPVTGESDWIVVRPLTGEWGGGDHDGGSYGVHGVICVR